jgi:UDP-N-acetylglucosamine--N-acetylmuramyl-(pentapeptide) pyrophosphoryl-undecaprenol N-acetylglucosamine transferase
MALNKIVLTGGGSAGHVTVNLALIPLLQGEGWSVDYIGSENGIERELLSEVNDVTYWPIATGKLRRYLDWQNVKDPFKVIKGLWQACRIISKQKPNVVFSKGGFVSVPVVLAAWMNRVPVLIHESDLTPGLANKIAIPFATGVCTTFPETGEALPSGKSRHIGAIVRKELFAGNPKRGRDLCGFRSGKPVLMVMGGSLGARRINEAVREALPELLQQFQIVHLCGKNGLDESISLPGYKQFPFVGEELPDLLAMTDVAVSRAGSNSIFEFHAVRIPMLLIPLPKGQSRGDQLLNAESFRKAGYCEVLQEEELGAGELVKRVSELYSKRDSYKANMERHAGGDSLTELYKWLLEIKKRSLK